jgi:hypothetical protein
MCKKDGNNTRAHLRNNRDSVGFVRAKYQRDLIPFHIDIDSEYEDWPHQNQASCLSCHETKKKEKFCNLVSEIIANYFKDINHSFILQSY